MSERDASGSWPHSSKELPVVNLHHYSDQRSMTLVGLANLGFNQALYISLLVILPSRVENIAGPAQKATILAAVASTGALVALVAAVLAGRVADRLVRSTGSRRRVLQYGAVGAAAALAALPFANTVGSLVLLWCCAQVGLNGVFTVVTATLVDRFDPTLRGRASAYAAVGQVGGAVLASALVYSLGPTPVIGVLGGAILLLASLPAARLGDHETTTDTPDAFGGRSYRDARLAWTVRVVVTLGNALVVTFITFYVTDALAMASPQRFVGLAAGLTSVFVLAGAIYSGRNSDRSGRRRIYVVWAVLIMAVGELVLALWREPAATLYACAVVGFGYGVYMAIDQALTTEVLPVASRYGRDTGFMNTANTIPQIAAPALGAVLLGNGTGYGVLFAAGAVITLSGAIFVLPIKTVR